MGKWWEQVVSDEEAVENETTNTINKNMENKAMQVTLRVGKRGEERHDVVVNVPYSMTVEEAKAKVTDEQIVELALVPAKAEAAKRIKRLLVKGLAVEKIEELMATWTPGATVAGSRKPADPVAAAKEKIDKLIAKVGREEALAMLGLA